jgi:hypothetical protein
MLHEYHVIYSVRYYLWFHVTAVGVGMYYLWISGAYLHIYINKDFIYRKHCYMFRPICIIFSEIFLLICGIYKNHCDFVGLGNKMNKNHCAYINIMEAQQARLHYNYRVIKKSLYT